MSFTADRLWALLGVTPDLSAAPDVTWAAPVPSTGGQMRRFTLAARGRTIPGILLLPEGPGPHPAVLYAHAHGNVYGVGSGELLEGRPALLSPYGPALLREGIASLCIDLAPFGARQSEGSEAALAKSALWHGRTLLGEMVLDLTDALTLLTALPEIDARRVASLGLSMGGTLAYWLAALDPRLCSAAHLCVFSDLAPLIGRGTHDLHGPYLTVPGLLREADMSDVAALIAPRPQFVGLGHLDPLTPDLPDSSAVQRLRAAYAETPASLTFHLEPDAAHLETARMREAVLRFLRAHLGAKTA